MNRIRVLLLLVGLCSAAASAAPPKLTVIAGAGGYVRPGAMAPVHIVLEISEESDAYDGRVAARFSSGMGTTPVAVRPVELNPGATKLATVYLLVPSDVREIEVWHETLNGRRIGSPYTEAVRALESAKPVLLAAGAFPPSMPSNQRDGQALFFQLNLQPQHLPQRHEGLEMFDAILINPAPALPLQSDQIDAIKAWVMRGGTLVVDASRRTDFLRTRAIDELLPFVPQGATQHQIPELGGEVVVAVGTPREAEVLLTLAGVPLVYRRQYGLGSVVAFAIDPQTAGLNEWDGRERLWHRVFDDHRMIQPLQPEAQFTMSPFALSQDGSPELIESLSKQVAPNAPSTGLRLGLVLVLTALYALAVGPGDYFLIKRLGRPKLTWITFPAIVATFTLAAYGGARWWIGGEMSARAAHRILAFPQIDRAIHYEAMGLFVPQGSTYEVTHDGPGMIRHLGELLARDDRILLDQENNVLHHRIPIWTHRVYGVSTTTDEYPKVDVAVRGTDVKITNNTRATLQNLRLYGNRAANQLDRLAPGKSATLALPTASIRVHDQADVLSGLYPLNDRYPSMMREFTSRKALNRGAIVLDCIMGTMPAGLIVDGAPRTETGPVRLQVLMYPDQQIGSPEEAATP